MRPTSQGGKKHPPSWTLSSRMVLKDIVGSYLFLPTAAGVTSAPFGCHNTVLGLQHLLVGILLCGRSGHGRLALGL